MSKPFSVSVPGVSSSIPQLSISRSGAGALLIRIAGAGGMLLCHVVLARSLGVTGFGEYAQAITWAQVFGVFGKLGLDNTSLRYVSEYMTKGETSKLNGFIRDSTWASILTSMLITFIVIITILVNRNSLGDSLSSSMMIACLMIPLVSLRQIQEASLRCVGQVWKSQISMVTWPVTLCMLVMIVWSTSSSGVSSPTATLLHLITMVAVSGLIYYFLQGSQLQMPRETRREMCRRQWFNTALAFFLAELLIVLKTRVNVALAGAFLGRDSAGLYAAMERFAEVSALGSQSLGLVIAPQFAALFAAGKFREMRQLMWYGQLLALASTLPIALGIVCVRDYLFLLLGAEYREGWHALLALLASACIASFAGPSAYVLQMTGRERTMLALIATCAVSNILLSLLLMPSLGILGLGISQMATSLIWAVWLRLSLRRHPVWNQSTAKPLENEFVLQARDAA